MKMFRKCRLSRMTLNVEKLECCGYPKNSQFIGSTKTLQRLIKKLMEIFKVDTLTFANLMSAKKKTNLMIFKEIHTNPKSTLIKLTRFKMFVTSV